MLLIEGSTGEQSTGGGPAFCLVLETALFSSLSCLVSLCFLNTGNSLATREDGGGRMGNSDTTFSKLSVSLSEDSELLLSLKTANGKILTFPIGALDDRSI